MRVLSQVRPTAEQLKVIQDQTPGFTLVRGAAGSGKTTTAVYRLRLGAGVWRRQRRRTGGVEPIRVLVLTYNRTLRGYVEELARQQFTDRSDVALEISTFARWARERLGRPALVENDAAQSRIQALGAQLGLSPTFLVDEVDYALGRFRPTELEAYLTSERQGRGRSPRVDRTLRRRLLDEVIEPYTRWKVDRGEADWHDLAVRLAAAPVGEPYDVVVIDEAQDFSANQVRAVTRQLAESHTTTFVLDAMQQIYPRRFTWREAGLEIPTRNIFRLEQNHRNTREIAAFALPLLEGVELVDDGTLPDFESCTRSGPLPEVVRGRFERQLDHVLKRVRAVPPSESVALLHPRGGGWFRRTRERLAAAGMVWVDIQQRPEWPQGPQNIALSTLHSAKGLEFDHVIILGLSAKMLPHGREENDAELDNHRRLVAMAVGRARESLILTFKPGEASAVVDFLRPGTFREVAL